MYRSSKYELEESITGTSFIVPSDVNSQESHINRKSCLFSHPIREIPPSIGLHLWNFGYIESNEEVFYINSMINDVNKEVIIE